MAYRILLVDDEADILEFIRYNLEKEDYEVFTASNGREAVETALRVVPHLILLDVMMPEMDGIETCREIRSHDSLRRTLIAFLTGSGRGLFPDCRVRCGRRRLYRQADPCQGAAQPDQGHAQTIRLNGPRCRRAVVRRRDRSGALSGLLRGPSS